MVFGWLFLAHFFCFCTDGHKLCETIRRKCAIVVCKWLISEYKDFTRNKYTYLDCFHRLLFSPPLAPLFSHVLNQTICMCWRGYLLDSSSDEWTQRGFPGTFQSFVRAPWWIPPGLHRTCILPSRHTAPWCCSPGSRPWCNAPNVPPCKYHWIQTHSYQTNEGRRESYVHWFKYMYIFTCS